MKTIPILLATIACSCAFAAGPLTRVWTDVQGRKVEATFVRIEGDMIALQTRDGAVFAFKLANLPPQEQAIARAATPFEPPSQADQIDQLVTKMLKAKGIKPNPPTSDEQFMRRAYLTIVGRIPTYAETQEFLDSTSTKKRDQLIDRLLDSEGYTSHLYNYFADMFRVIDDPNQPMQRTLPYIQWLKRQISDNRPYDQMSYDMLTASGKMWSNGATGYLLRDSGMLLDNLANTFAVFLGTNVACAQCHDHPFSEWTQKQFYELASFFGATVTNLNRDQFKNGDPKMRLEAGLKEMASKSGTDFTKFEGVMNDIINANRNEVRDLKENRLRLPQDYKYKDGKPGEMVKPKLIRWDGEKRNNEAYKQNTKKEEKLRQAFASWMTHPTNPRFSITIANRLWKRAFGTGIAEPVTNVDDPKSSSNPELLTYLGKEMVRLKFNLKEFQRLIYKTAAWQRASTVEDVPMGMPYYFQGPLLQRMTAEQTWDSLMTLVLGTPDSYKGTNGARYAATIDVDLEKTTVPIMAQKVSAFIKMRESEEARMGGTLADAGSTMESKKILQYGDMKLLRASELDQPAADGHFLREFGQSQRISMDGGSRAGSEPQVLMLMNGPVQEMLTSKESLPYRTMTSKPTPGEKVESLFLTVLGRHPTTRERESAMITLKDDGEDAPANLIWALITSLEFLFVQ